MGGVLVDPILVLSPHFDDAVLSMGQVLAGRPDVVVATVCSAVPPDEGMLTSYDESCGFRSAREAVGVRTVEDARALNVLHAYPTRLGFVDHQYRDGPLDETALTEAIWTLAAAIEGVSVVVAPLGLAHPDHYAVARAAAAAARDVELWCYEDLPARVLWPEEVPDRLESWRVQGYKPELGFMGTGPGDLKLRAVRHYRSQLWAEAFGGPGLHNVLVPERLWRMQRT